MSWPEFNFRVLKVINMILCYFCLHGRERRGVNHSEKNLEDKALLLISLLFKYFKQDVIIYGKKCNIILDEV